MNSLTQKSNPELLNATRALATEERRIGIEILHYLREIEARRLHLEMGYSSAEASAYQKIQALRLMQEVPEVEEKLKHGSLTLSNAAQVQSFAQSARRQNIEVPSRESLIARVEHKSKRETEKILAALAPVSVKPDRVRAVTSTHSEVRFMASERLMHRNRRSSRLHVNWRRREQALNCTRVK